MLLSFLCSQPIKVDAANLITFGHHNTHWGFNKLQNKVRNGITSFCYNGHRQKDPPQSHNKPGFVNG